MQEDESALWAVVWLVSLVVGIALSIVPFLGFMALLPVVTFFGIPVYLALREALR